MYYHPYRYPSYFFQQSPYPISPRQVQGVYGQWGNAPNVPPHGQQPFSFNFSSPIAPSNYGFPPINQMQHGPFYKWMENPLHPIYQANNPYGDFSQGTMSQPNNITASLINSFKNQDGTMDVNKMLSTTGQLIGTIDQLAGTFKGISSIFKV